MKHIRKYCLLGILVTTLASAQLLPPTVHGSDHVDAVAITITRFGPYPASIERPKGPFLLFIVNRSGALDDTFSLVLKPSVAAGSSETSAPALPSLLDLHSTHVRQRDHQLIELVPGNYELHFQSHPDWAVSIVVSGN